MSTPVVHVVDDDPAIRDALTSALSARGFAVAPYPSAVDFLDKVATARPGCVITDVQMPGMSGLALLDEMQGRLAEFPMIVLTGAGSVPMAVEALRAGASDFIEKPFEGETIHAAVSRALAKAEAASERAGRRAEVRQRLAALSPREREVLDRVVEGLSNKEVARDLGISHRTVEAYRAALMLKMDAGSLSELVRMTIVAEADAAEGCQP